MAESVDQVRMLMNNNQLNIEAKNCRLNPRDPNRRLHHLVPPNQIQFNSREIKNIHPHDLNLDKLSLQDGNKSRQRDQNNHYLKPRNLLETIFSLTDGQKLLIFLNLRRQLANLANHFPQYSDFANDLTKVKNLLLMKKETALIELRVNLPFIHPGNHEVKMTYMRIMPVLFSHVSLYDVGIDDVFQIIDLLRMHPGFIAQQNLFGQWYAIFDARRNGKKHFSFKDEFYVKNLPPLEICCFAEESLTHSIGYSDIALLRAFHRWLRSHRLHKYLYFFASLSYEEIFTLDDNNFDTYQEQINLHNITIGAKHKILREIEILRGRRECLLALLKMPQSQHTVEDTIKEIKRILRTPICVRDPLKEGLAELLLETMAAVFNFVSRQSLKIEKIVSLYGLFISICKEAWNYNIFKPEEKECFNDWRVQLMDRTGQTNSGTSYNTTKQVTIFMEDSKLRDQSAGNNYYQCLEEACQQVAKDCVDFVLLRNE